MRIKKILLNSIKVAVIFFVCIISIITIMVPLPCGSYRLSFFNAIVEPVKVEFYQRIDYRTETEGKRWTRKIGYGQTRIFRIPFSGGGRYVIDVTYPDGKVITEDLDYVTRYDGGVTYTFISDDFVKSTGWYKQGIANFYIPVLSDMIDIFYMIERDASCLDNDFLWGYPY